MTPCFRSATFSSLLSALCVLCVSAFKLSSQPTRQQCPRRHNRRIPLGSRRNHPNLHLQKIRNKPQIIERCFRQLRAIFHAVRCFIPPWQRLIFWGDVLVFFSKREHFPLRLPFVFVPHAYLNFALRIKNIQLGDHHRIDPVDHLRVAQDLQIQPAAAPWPPRHRAKFFSALAHFFGIEIGHFRRKRSAAHSSCVRFRNSKYVLDFCRWHTHARRRAAGCRTRRGYERIRSIVDVQHLSLCAFEQHGLTFVKSAIQKFRPVANIPPHLSTQLQRSFHFM